MPDSIKFHQEAKKYGSQKIAEYIEMLTSEARLAARRRNDRWILNSHIDEALETIQEKQCKRNKYQQISIAVGSAFFGAFISGFITELVSEKNGFALAVYVILGIAGTAIAMWGYAGR